MQTRAENAAMSARFTDARFEQGPDADAILSEGEGDAPIEAWQPDDFDHYTDVGLLRSLHAEPDRFG
jgi:uncharacterized protein YhfF